VALLFQYLRRQVITLALKFRWAKFFATELNLSNNLGKEMARTDSFRKQHNEILTIAREINGMLGSTIDDGSAEKIRSLLSKLAGLVNLHLAMEDKALYPTLLAHRDASVANTARRFSDEMGSVAAAFVGYINAWPNAAAIKADPVRFTTESKAIFNALSKRIHRENVELYVLLDAVEA
jgi:hypothetical protein